MLIQGGFIVQKNSVKKASLRLINGRIADIGEGLQPLPQEESEDASGCYIVPGGVDAHTHFDMPAGEFYTADDFTSGTRAAILGGTTTVIDFAECEGGAPLASGLNTWKEKAEGKTYCDYALHMTVSHWDGETEKQMAEMVRQGLPSFKVYTAYQKDIGVNDRELYCILRAAAKLGATVCVHCENGEVLELLQEELNPKRMANHPLSRPNFVEAEAVAKVLHFSAMTGAKVYIVHLSTAEALGSVQVARAAGLPVTAETCPHYLLLDSHLYAGSAAEAAKYILSPPLRSPADNRAMWMGLLAGDIQTVATDHCAFTTAQKRSHLEDYRRVPNGIPSVGQRLALMYHHGPKKGISLEKIAELTSENPARAFGLYPQKGCIQLGSDADLAILKLGKKRRITAAGQTSGADYTPYEGMEVGIQVRSVYLRGVRLVQNGIFTGAAPQGRFLRGQTN